MSERAELARTVIEELRAMREQVFEPTSDIDVVWVISQPGTVKRVSEDGIYEGISNDIKVARYGVELVRKITALRLGKSLDDVTPEDVEKFGPLLYYNGEDAATRNSKYTQNEDLLEMVSQPGFPIPLSKIKIDHIDELGTHTQTKGFAQFLRTFGEVRKVAAVSMAHHSRRVSRYLQHYRGLFPENIELVNASVAETDRAVGTTLREVRKIVTYAQSGDLAKDPYF